MIFGRRKVRVTPNYSAEATFEFLSNNPVWRMTVAVTDDVIMEVSESSPPIFVGSMDTEVELDKGTHSLNSFVNEVFGVRFRSVDAEAFLSLRCYGPSRTN